MEAALEVFKGVSLRKIRDKSMSLTTFFVNLFDAHLAEKGFTLESPRDPESRGSHVALGFAGGKDLVAAMASEGIIADFRPPDLMRFGFAPLYNTHQEVVSLVERLSTY
jgi:kynureninase